MIDISGDVERIGGYNIGHVAEPEKPPAGVVFEKFVYRIHGAALVAAAQDEVTVLKIDVKPVLAERIVLRSLNDADNTPGFVRAGCAGRARI